MSGYAATARLQGGSPRFVGAGGSRSGNALAHVAGAMPTRFDLDARERIELVGRPFGERLATRWDDLREAWSQLTFYLFDPESWR